MFTKLDIDLDEALDVLKQKEIRKPIIATNIVQNWLIAKEQKDSALGSIYCSEEIDNKAIEILIEGIQFYDLESSG